MGTYGHKEAPWTSAASIEARAIIARSYLPVEELRDVAGGVRAPMLKYVCGSCGYTTSSTIDITGKRCVKCTDGIMRRYIV